MTHEAVNLWWLHHLPDLHVLHRRPKVRGRLLPDLHEHQNISPGDGGESAPEIFSVLVLCLWSVLVFTCACMPAACSLSVCACSFHSAAWTSSWSGESTHKHVTFFFMDSSCSFIAKHFFVLSIASLSNYSDRDNNSQSD